MKTNKKQLIEKTVTEFINSKKEQGVEYIQVNEIVYMSDDEYDYLLTIPSKYGGQSYENKLAYTFLKRFGEFITNSRAGYIFDCNGNKKIFKIA